MSTEIDGGTLSPSSPSSPLSIKQPMDSHDQQRAMTISSEHDDQDTNQYGSPQDADGNGLDVSTEPDESMPPFDWEDLHDRYQEAMQEKQSEEEKLLQEFSSLSQYFAAWASTIEGHEQERSYKRLQTQITYVQHEEDVLEKRKEHYVQVVTAFKQALELLNN